MLLFAVQSSTVGSVQVVMCTNALVSRRGALCKYWEGQQNLWQCKTRVRWFNMRTVARFLGIAVLNSEPQPRGRYADRGNEHSKYTRNTKDTYQHSG